MGTGRTLAADAAIRVVAVLLAPVPSHRLLLARRARRRTGTDTVQNTTVRRHAEGRYQHGSGLQHKMSGGVLLSHAVPHAVPSALKGLTSGFGMGPGVSPSPWPPKHY